MNPATTFDEPPVSLAPRDADATDTASGKLTIAEFEAKYDGQDFELVRGKLIPMSKNNITHAKLLARTTTKLGNHLEGKPVTLLGGDAGFVTSEVENTSRGVDIIVISDARLSGQAAGRPFLTVAPEVAIEITSPSNTTDDMLDKVSEYFAAGVEAVWVITPHTKQVLVWSSAKHCDVISASANETLIGSGILEGFSMPLTELFA
ncbi:MAG: Uma2 family endonuclease [Roseimicrobium sp.]